MEPEMTDYRFQAVITYYTKHFVMYSINWNIKAYLLMSWVTILCSCCRSVNKKLVYIRLIYYSTGVIIHAKGAKQPRVPGGKWAMGWIVQHEGANQPWGDKAIIVGKTFVESSKLLNAMLS